MSTREDAQEFLQRLSLCKPTAFFEDVDITRKGICCVLAYLKQSDREIIAGDLAKELQVSTARIAALLKKMEKNSLIVRHTSSGDARKTVVRITPEGIAYINEEIEKVLSQVELLIKKVGKKELDEFIRISYKIKAALDE